jgi:hypothetical protein
MCSLFTVYKQTAVLKTNTISCTYAKRNNMLFMQTVTICYLCTLSFQNISIYLDHLKGSFM